MALANSLWTVTSLQRYRFPIIALACLAAGATIYYAQNLQPEAESTEKPQGNLHRSNASRRTRLAGVPPESEEQILWEQALAAEGGPNAQFTDGGQTENDGASEFSWEGQDEGKEEVESKDGQSLLLLLYKIAEEQSRTDSYVHRGVACDSCNENPIKGIRYRCVNCADHDLCETCESTQTHNRQHLFLKIRIPAPQLGTRKERQPVFYPGKPKAIIQDLRKEKVDKFCKETGYKSEEVEAFWEQFRSMAATEWPKDPDHYGLAIDRPTFDQCFVPSTSGRLPPPNLIYNRIFSYYDANDDGLIGFAEFIKGLASLKKKNMAERMKRVFKGYDINNDGYVDRKDFLKMFRAYYAHMKELMGDIVASMQDDDDQDTRELVSGGQPISSAFNGPGPIRSGEIRRGRTGKIQNNFGDYETTDNMGAVDEQEFNPDAELDSIIAENAEAVRWPHSVSRPDFLRSGLAIHNFVTYSSQEELESLMKFYNLHGFIREPSAGEDAEKNFRRALHGKLADELRRRRVDRRDAITRRTQRQSFYQYQEISSSSLQMPQEVGGMLVNRRLHTQIQKDLEDVQYSQSFDEFNRQVIEMVEALDWPFEMVVDFKNSIFDMVRKGWSCNELSLDLDGYSPDPKEVEEFVFSFVELLSRTASEVRQQPRHKADLGKLSVPAKSRSSPKVRFDESLGTDKDGSDGFRPMTSHYSRSGSFNDRWSAFEAPEPETDVGREVLFAVTEEALNELLDPVFKLREDLALRALLEKNRRAKYRANIIAAVPAHQSLRDVKLYLERYSRRWRQTKERPPPPPRDQDDETVFFAQFVYLMVSGTVNPGNGTKCIECLKRNRISWVRIGEYCTQTQNHRTRPTGQPQGRRLVDEKTWPAEVCPMCAQMGKESWISGLYCGHCGQPCSRLIAEEAKIRRIIESGGEVPPFDLENDTSSHTSLERSSSPNQSSSEIADDEEAAAKIMAPAEPSSNLENFSTTCNVQEEPSAPHRLSESPKPLDEATIPDVPQTAEPKEPAAVYRDTASYLKIAHDLHSSVIAFNSFDPAHLEAIIASKPLDELLAESGYASTEADSPSSRPAAPDPTLPQNRPNANPSHKDLSIPQATFSSSSSSPSDEKTREETQTKKQQQQQQQKRQQCREDNTDTNTSATAAAKKDLDDGGNSNSKSKSEPDPTDDDVPNEAQCKFYACLDIVVAEDRERGGPGRINFQEFEEIMMGEKGAALGFLASWVDIGAF